MAYQGAVRAAWSWLPTSTICEMAAVTVFAFNLLIAFAREAPAVAAQPLREPGYLRYDGASNLRCSGEIKVLIILVLSPFSRAQLFL